MELAVSNFGSMSDSDLVRHIQGTDFDCNNLAIAELYQRYIGRMVKFARKIVGNHDDAEDLAQEVFMEQVVKGRLNRYVEGNFIGWLHTCVRHQCYTYLRRNKYTHLNLDDEERVAASSADDGFEDQTLDDLVLACVWIKFRQTATALELSVVDSYLSAEYCVSSAAQMIGMEPKAFSNILHKARQRLRTLRMSDGKIRS